MHASDDKRKARSSLYNGKQLHSTSSVQNQNHRPPLIAPFGLGDSPPIGTSLTAFIQLRGALTISKEVLVRIDASISTTSSSLCFIAISI